MMKILESYKKMAKSMLIEHAWERKFGAPLVTLEDTTKKHQTEAEPGQGGGGHKEGDVWQTSSGWAAWKPGEKSAEYGIKDKGAAEKYAKGEKVGYDDGDHDEKEPAGKLGGGDFERDFDDSEPEDKPFGGDTGKDADSETGKDYTSKFQGTDEPKDEPEGGDAPSDNTNVEPDPEFDEETVDTNAFNAIEHGEGEKWIEEDDPSIDDMETVLRDLQRKGYQKTDDDPFKTGPDTVQKYIDALKSGKSMKYGDKYDMEDDEREVVKNKVGIMMNQFVKQNPIEEPSGGEPEESISINGKKYREVKEETTTDKHLLREMFERIGGK